MAEDYGQWNGAIEETRRRQQECINQIGILHEALQKTEDGSAEEANIRAEIQKLQEEVERYEADIYTYKANAIDDELKEQEVGSETESTPPSDGSAIQEQRVTSSAGGTIVEQKSMGNNSNLVNTAQEIKSNGDMKISSDLGSTDLKQNDFNNINQGNSTKSTNGNDSNFTNGLNETAAGSSSRIVGNPAEVQNGITEEINREKASIVAGRSGFNDDREEQKLGISDLIKDAIGFPKAVLEGIGKTLEDVATDEDESKITNGKSLFSSMMSDIEAEIKPIIKKWSKTAAETKKEQAIILGKNKIEKMKKQLELIEKMPESAHKQRLKKAIEEGNIELTYGELHNEKKEKNSTFDQNKYDEEVIKYIEKVLELERKRS